MSFSTSDRLSLGVFWNTPIVDHFPSNTFNSSDSLANMTTIPLYEEGEIILLVAEHYEIPVGFYVDIILSENIS